jgi:NDP-sugar pyrophosphorylase family protein
MDDFALVMPMAGRGSRFSKMGMDMPKPLIELGGKPFFWWAVESLRRSVPLREMVFVVLEEHCERYAIHERICAYYNEARIVRIAEVTSGAAETAAIGLNEVATNGPVALNDCDHAFHSDMLAEMARRFNAGDADAAVMCFRSDNPAYSYAEVDSAGLVTGTVEKKVVSPYAIAGCYLFAEPAVFLDAFVRYREQCPYDELFVSGIYNLLAEEHRTLLKADMQQHWSFGTPEEYQRMDPSSLTAAFPAAARS